MPRTIVLAYSGGLDTSIIVPWLKEHYDARIICVAADIGQGEAELRGVREKALASGAEECFVEDLRSEFVSDFIFPTLRAGAIYNRKYLLGTSMARPLIAKRQVEIARRVGADALAHGCTGKGNDQVRCELTYARFAPDLPVIAPWRMWDIRSREDALAYAAAHGMAVAATKEKIYSRDANIWHLSHEGGVLEDPAQAAPADLLMLTSTPENAPDVPELVTIEFDRGTPIAVNGDPFDPVGLLTVLNEIGGRNGVGVIDLVEDRMVGMKSRGVYETPGGTLLYAAHSELEQLVLDRRTLSAKDLIAPRYADLVYEGRWWTTEREAYDAFVSVTQQRITGTVTLRLYKGSVNVIGRESVHALYDERFVTFGEDDVYEQSDAAGFIRLFALPARVRAIKDQELAAAHTAGNGASALPDTEQTPAGALAGVGVHAPRRSDDGHRRGCPARLPRRAEDAQALGWTLRRGPHAGVRRTQQFDRHRLPAVAVRRAALQGVGGSVVGRRCAHARREQDDRARPRRRLGSSRGRREAAGVRRGRPYADRPIVARRGGRRRLEAAHGPKPKRPGLHRDATLDDRRLPAARQRAARTSGRYARAGPDARDGAHAVVYPPAARHPGLGRALAAVPFLAPRARPGATARSASLGGRASTRLRCRRRVRLPDLA